MSIISVIEWKFPGIQGVVTRDDVITEYPGDIPSQEDLNTWTAEYVPAKAMADLREERNRRLAETDWWSCSDSPEMTDAQTAYRQALRDLPATVPTAPVDDIEAMKSWPVWPDKP